MKATGTPQLAQFNYYLAHQDELLKQYENKYLVLKDESVAGAYDSPAAAVHFSRKAYEPGTYIIQLCTPGDSAYTIRSNSPVFYK